MPATWLDRAIGFVAPAAGRRRLRERHAFEATLRAYAGADSGRRSAGWNPRGTSANAELALALPNLRDRMRDLVRNNPHAAKAVSTIVVHAVGSGIMPRAKSGNKRLDRKVDVLFDAWTKVCHSKGRLDFYGLQTLVCREFIEAGEVLVRRRSRRLADGLPVPLQLQVIEADHLDSAKDGDLGSGVIAVQGVEQDAFERPTGYWLYPVHPGAIRPVATLPKGGRSSRVPADDIAHVFELRRDQDRGEPWGVAAMASLKDLGTYEEAEVMRKQIEACTVGVVTGEDPEPRLGGTVGADEERQFGIFDGSGFRVERFEPGMFLNLHGGQDIKFHSPVATGSFEAYKRVSLQAIAAGFRVPYELISGDLAHVSYISGRLGMQEFYRLMEQVQWQILIPMFCERVWGWFCGAAYDAGLIPTATVAVEWSPPRMPAVDPFKQAMADLLDMRAGTRSHPEIVHERGRNPDDVLTEIAAFNAAVDAAGIVLDSDPRKVAKSGVLQVSEAQSAAPEQAVGSGQPKT